MKKEILFELSSPYRDAMRITAFQFGAYQDPAAENSCAIVGGTRGNEAQQIYFCARLVAALRDLEAAGGIRPNKKIMVIPTVNNYSVNTNKRFWSLDNTDINRMFPGYEIGETTQQIAYHVFEYVKDYVYGIQFASYYMTGQFIPHIRIMQTGYESPETAAHFALPYVYVRKVRPYDTTTLNYNWQIWGTKAFSFYAGKSEEIDEAITQMTVQSVLHFLTNTGIIRGEIITQKPPRIITREDLLSVMAETGGILRQIKNVGNPVAKGELVGTVLDPYDGSIRQKLYALARGRIFYINSNPFIYENTVVYRILKD